MITEFILAALACLGTLAATMAVYFRTQGDSEILFDTGAARDSRVTKNMLQRTIRCRCLIPLTNHGRQNGMVINVFCQPMYYGQIMEQLDVTVHLRLLEPPVHQNSYWEAVIIKKNTTQAVELDATIHARTDMVRVIKEIPCLKVIIYYQVVGRDGIQWHLSEAKFDLTG
jgi:hypothetical protein